MNMKTTTVRTGRTVSYEKSVVSAKRWIFPTYPFLLILLFFLLVVLSVPGGSVYGSNTDWLSQHVALAQTIRDACLKENTLAPAFLSLGGGSNGYLFSYYGYFRPDILIGCLFPQISMEWILMGYMLAGFLAGGLLFYKLLQMHGIQPFFAFLGSVLYLTAACFFHTHRQIMFVNYMPFFLGALLAVKTKKTAWLPLLMALVYFHSFYYGPVCLAVLFWYWYRQEGSFRFLGTYIKKAAISVGLAAMLLLPTALVLLEHKRTSQAGAGTQLLPADLSMNALLYSPYGMGLTAVCLYILLMGLSLKAYRKDSMVYLLCIICPFVSLLLNGGLYARPKILIPFVPLILIQTVSLLQDAFLRKITLRLWPLLPIGIITFAAAYYRNSVLPALDGLAAGLLLAALFLIYDLKEKKGRFPQRPVVYGIHLCLCIMPCVLFLHTARTDDFVTQKQLSELDSLEKSAAYMDQLNAVSSTGTLYRTDSLVSPLGTGNRLLSSSGHKATMYSSISSKAYSELYYDLLHTPIRINNRVALLSESNPFLEQLMGIRTLWTTAQKLPAGYEVKASDGDLVLAENPSVLPVAYTTSDCMGENQFEQLAYPQDLDAISQYTLVPEKESVPFDTQIKAYEPRFAPITVPDTVELTSLAQATVPGTTHSLSAPQDAWSLKVKKETSLFLPFQTPLKNQLLLLQFQVVSKNGRAVTIDVNHIRNRLSSEKAAYPNGNHLFSYQISPDRLGQIKGLELVLSKGSYMITNVQWHTCPISLLSEKQVLPLDPVKTQGNELLAGTVSCDRDGYFVTSIPKQNGMKLLVDGQETPIETVNHAFAGAAVTKGTHQVSLQFTVPGQRAGYMVSLAALLCFLGSLWLSRKKRTDTWLL